MQKKNVFIGVLALVVIVAATSMAVNADRPKLRTAGDSSRVSIPQTLPPVDQARQEIAIEKATSVLQWDDGSCESGLGAGTTVTAWVDFDVPTQCVMGGLEVVGATARFNTANTAGSAQAALLGQAGAAPPAVGGGTNIGLSSPFPEGGPCDGGGGGLVQRGVGGVVTGTDNFFLGIRNGGFMGRDTNGAPAGKIWLGCGTCGMTQYSPAFLDANALGGNWMIRATVEDTNCLPAELEGACCLSETECAVLTVADCGAQDGLFKGEGVECTADPFELCESLWVTMHSMSASVVKGGVAISWVTEQEVDTVAFRVLRETPGRQKGMDVVAQIASMGTSIEGGSYSVTDDNRAAGFAQVYWLEDIDLNGRVQRHGPIFVQSGRSR